MFDAVSALLGLCDRITYEGQAAIRLQERADCDTDEIYEYEIDRAADPAVVSFAPMIRKIAEEKMNGVEVAKIAKKFHNTIAAATAETCAFIGEAQGLDRVALSGGVFQNDLLLAGRRKKLTQTRPAGLYSYNNAAQRRMCIVRSIGHSTMQNTQKQLRDKISFHRRDAESAEAGKLPSCWKEGNHRQLDEQGSL